MVPLAGSAAVASLPAEQIEKAQAHLDLIENIVDDLPARAGAELPEIAGDASGEMTAAEGAGLRMLRTLIFDHDRSRQFGGLRRVQSVSGEYLWICPDHYSEYDPGLPDLP